MTGPHFQNDAWRTAVRSNEEGGACVAVNYPCTATVVGMRDSKSPTTGTLVFPVGAWTAFRVSLEAASPDV
jgi:hypothetical protein